jgi:hypothetical protein
MDDLREEIQCRIDYYKQLCKDRQFIDQDMYHYYRGSATSLEILLSYMERGITGTSEDIPKKILKSKDEKSRLISNILNGEKHHIDKGYEVDTLEAQEKFEKSRTAS